jgi:hypothetical protein
MNIARKTILASTLVALGACAESPEANATAEAEASPVVDVDEERAELRGAGAGAALGPGAKTKLADVVAAENQVSTGDGRLFVTGDEGIFELVAGGAGVTKVTRAPKQDCKFGGIVESRGVLYANCYAFPDSFVYAAPLGGDVSFRRVFTLEGAPLANGLAADAGGRLYVASTLAGQIARLAIAPDDPFTITGREVWLDHSGPLTNGLKYQAGAVYWSDGGTIKRAVVRPDGRPGPVSTLVVALTVFDDLAVDAQGIVVADFLGGALRSYDLDGCFTGSTPFAFVGPSSVARAKGPAFEPGALIVTERGGNRVSLFEPSAALGATPSQSP